MRKLVGLVIILFGVGFLLQQLNIPWAENIIDTWWPLIIIAIGIISWTNNPRHVFGPLMIVLVGLILLFDELAVFDRSAWELFWPVVIILVGARFLLGHRNWDERQPETGSADANVVFSGIDRKVTGPFSSGDISAWFGGVKLDLREAEFVEAAQLSVFAAFGGVELLVPKNVKIVTRVMPLFGGADDKSTPDPGANKTLTVSGTAMFGGVSIKN